MSQELREYITRAKELEAAIYTQQKLMEEHRGILEEQEPVAPVKTKINEPQKPIYPHPIGVDTSGNAFIYFILIIFGCIGICLFVLLIYAYDDMDFPLAALCGVAIGVVSIVLLIKFIRENIELRKETEKDNAHRAQCYRQELSVYEKEKTEYLRKVHQANTEYNNQYTQFSEVLVEYHKQQETVMANHAQLLHDLTSTLEAHYAQNILFPKYRNLVAVSSIEEYLLSGRCATLEGANGAYNLYEMELRQNIVIGQLASVLDNLEQIKSNQYSLYQELNRANEEIREITAELRTVRENTKLTAYFSALNAKIAASPKIVHGHIH